jgi:hypothetical protein
LKRQLPILGGELTDATTTAATKNVSFIILSTTQHHLRPDGRHCCYNVYIFIIDTAATAAKWEGFVVSFGVVADAGPWTSRSGDTGTRRGVVIVDRFVC